MSENFPEENVVRWVPTDVIGCPAVCEVAVFPDRLELYRESEVLTFWLSNMGERSEWRITSRMKRLIGISPKFQIVGERDWCRNPPHSRFFRWYTAPAPITTFMPREEPRGYAISLFPKIHHVLGLGGFATYDLA